MYLRKLIFFVSKFHAMFSKEYGIELFSPHYHETLIYCFKPQNICHTQPHVAILAVIYGSSGHIFSAVKYA
jgi:hypothetical protein